MKFCSARSASASVCVAMNSMFAISSSRSLAPRVDGLEKCEATRFFSDFALPT
jgi:hypothetical protein